VRGAYASLSATQVVPWTSEGSGLFKKEGVDVSLTFISPATLTAGLLSNNLDIAYGPGNAVATVESQGGDLIAVGGPFAGPQFSMVADKSVATIKDLKGKTITVTQRGSSADLLVADLMKQQGYGPGDYNVVYIPTPADELAAFASGAANAVVTGEPTASQAVGLGGHVVLAAKDTGGKYNTLSVLMLRKSYLAGHREQVKRVLMANMEAAHIIKTNPDQVAQAIAKQYLKIDDLSVVSNSVKAVAPFVNQDMTFPTDAMQNIINETATTVPAVANLKAQDLVDFSVIDEIKASGFLDTLK
jgi:NitT/TauT family transport system substrate-binding protein